MMILINYLDITVRACACDSEINGFRARTNYNNIIVITENGGGSGGSGGDN